MNAAIGARIRELRESKKLSQEDVATKLGFSRQRLGRIENGDVDISYATICKIADILGVLPSQITSAAEERSSLGMLFRKGDMSKINEECEKLFDILDTIYAHRNIYMRTKKEVY
ncbi:MAG TPA: helix-turn-helix transcriptional regulator [Defluviitaleaceae bacterium]|jgi:transcriptional regulator with XRE-family HTH domain|nr:helix-turn-helix transcriptional regulator [Defluviitaleaceae bacterium]